jgi:hypothetical protein
MRRTRPPGAPAANGSESIPLAPPAPLEPLPDRPRENCWRCPMSINGEPQWLVRLLVEPLRLPWDAPRPVGWRCLEPESAEKATLLALPPLPWEE